MYLMANGQTVYVSNESERKQESSEESKKLTQLASETSDVIYEVRSVFPFQLFPDKLIIDTNKITIVRKELFFKRIIPISYEDLITVMVNRSIIFASIDFDVKRLDRSHNPRGITFLWPAKATIAKKYITGILTAKKAGVDFSKLTTTQIKKRLKEIGSGTEEAEALF